MVFQLTAGAPEAELAALIGLLDSGVISEFRRRPSSVLTEPGFTAV
jgi:hypothetical protein